MYLLYSLYFYNLYIYLFNENILKINKNIIEVLWKYYKNIIKISEYEVINQFY